MKQSPTDWLRLAEELPDGPGILPALLRGEGGGFPDWDETVARARDQPMGYSTPVGLPAFCEEMRQLEERMSEEAKVKKPRAKKVAPCEPPVMCDNTEHYHPNRLQSDGATTGRICTRGPAENVPFDAVSLAHEPAFDPPKVDMGPFRAPNMDDPEEAEMAARLGQFTSDPLLLDPPPAREGLAYKETVQERQPDGTWMDRHDAAGMTVGDVFRVVLADGEVLRQPVRVVAVHNRSTPGVFNDGRPMHTIDIDVEPWEDGPLVGAASAIDMETVGLEGGMPVPTPVNDRIAHVLQQDGSWDPRPLLALMKGDTFWLSEADGTPVDSGERTIAVEDAYVNAEGIHVVRCKHVNPQARVALHMPPKMPNLRGNGPVNRHTDRRDRKMAKMAQAAVRKSLKGRKDATKK